MIRLTRKSWIFLYVVVMSLIYNKWFLNWAILTSGDWPFFFKETLSSVRASYFFVWYPSNMGMILLDIAQAPTYALAGYLGHLGLQYNLIERIVYFFPIVFLTPIFSYIFLAHILKNKIASLVGSIAYCFNTYMLTLQSGHITLMVACSFLPLVLYFFIVALERYSYKHIILSALASLVCIIYEPRIFYIILGILFIYTIFQLCFEAGTNKSKTKIFLLFLNFACIVVFLNIYWLITLINAGSLVNNELFSRGLWGNEYLDISHAITAMHPWWNGRTLSVFDKQPIAFRFWLIPFIAFLGLVFQASNRKVLFFGLLAIIGILLSKQSDYPFPHLYQWLYTNFPGFNAFREASKFFIMVVLSYSVLIGSLIVSVSEFKIKAYIKQTLIFGIVLLFLWNAKPIFTGSMQKLFLAREVPNDYLVLKDYILNQDDYFRTLWIPGQSRWAPYTNNHPAVNAVSIINSDWKDLAPTNMKVDAQVGNILNQEYFKTLIDDSSIKFIIIPIKDEISEGDEIFLNYGEREFYITVLDHLSYLNRVDIGTKDLIVYENKDYKPHIFLSTNPTLVKDDMTAFSGKISGLSTLLFSDDIHDFTSMKARINNFELNPFSPENIIVKKNEVQSKLNPSDFKNYNFYHGNTVEDIDESSRISISTEEISGENIYRDGNFEERKTVLIGDCNNYDSTPLSVNGIKYQFETDADHGTVLSLSANNHTACVSQDLQNFNNSNDYLISLDYKVIEGTVLGISIYPRKTEPQNKITEVPFTDQQTWKTHSEIVKMEDLTEKMSLIFYLSGEGNKPSRVLIDNVEVYALPRFGENFLRTDNRTLPKIEATYKYYNPTKYKVSVLGLTGSRLLYFSESYHPRWKVFINKKNNQELGWWRTLFMRTEGYNVSDKNHIIASAHANGWWIDPSELPDDIRNDAGEYEIVIEFWPQRYFYIGLVISGLTLLGCIGYLVYDWRKRRRLAMLIQR